jgi:SAM-dependent methyltransferase
MHPEPERWKAATARQFDGIAERFRGFGLPDEARLAPVLAALDCAPGGLILDAGSGTGNWSVALARRGYRVAGFDISPQMVANAVAVAREHGLGEERVSFRRGDAERIDFPDDTFDAAICFNVLDFAPRPGVALVELRRVLKPGRRLLLRMLGARSPIKREWWRRFLPGNDEVHTGNDILPWEMAALLRELGWEIVEQRQEDLPSPGTAAGPRATAGGRGVLPYAPADDLVVQQAIADFWLFVARKPAE